MKLFISIGVKRFESLVLFLFLSQLHAGISDHYKKIEGERRCKSLKNIDYVYLINLDQRPERWLQSLTQLAPYEIIPQRFPAIYGWTLDVEVLNDMGLKFQHGMWTGKEYVMIFPPDKQGVWDFMFLNGASYGTTCFSGWTVKGTLGCTLSHLSVLKDAWDFGYQTVWILEDDMQIVDNPHKLSQLIEELDQLVGPNEWDVLYTDFDCLVISSDEALTDHLTWLWRPDMFLRDFSYMNVHVPLNPHFVKIGSRNRAHSIIYRRCGIEKIMNFYQTHGNFLPYDMEMALIPGMKIFTLTEPIVSVHEVTSDTRCKYFSPTSIDPQ